jgi:cytochrome P450
MQVDEVTDQKETAEEARQPIRFGSLPQPPALPAFGSLLAIDPPRAHQVLESWAARYGTPFRVRMGSRYMLVIDDKDEIARILRQRPQAFRRGRPVKSVFAELGVAGLFSAEGEDWERQRRLVMKAFAPAHLKQYFPSLVKVTDRLLGRFKAAAASGEWLDLQAEFMRYTVDVTAGLAFGEDINTIEGGDDVLQRHLDKVFPAMNRRMTAFWPYWRYARLPRDVALDRSVAEIKKAITGFVARARERLSADPSRAARPLNLIEALVVACDTPGSGVTDADVAGNVFTALLAGEDTTANTLAWLCHALCEHPESQFAAAQEVAAVLPVGVAAREMRELEALPYLEAAIRESMRLWPVAPVLFHESNGTDKVCGIEVRPKTPIATLMRPAGLDARQFAHPMAFAPSRWLDGKAGQANPQGSAQAKLLGVAPGAAKALMPFGAGPRFCPGRYLAMLEIKMVASMMLANFSMERDTRQAVTEKFSMSLAPEGLRVRLRAR